MVERSDRGVEPDDGHRIGRRPERGGDRPFVAGFDTDQHRDRTQQSVELVGGGEQRRGCVLAVQADVQRLDPGGQRGSVLRGGELLPPQLSQLFVQRGQIGDRLFVLGVQAEFAGIEAGHLGLQGGERPRGLLRPFGRLLARGGQPADLGRRRLRPAAQRVDLSDQPGQTLTPVGRGPDQRGQPGLLGAVRLLAAGAMGTGLLQGSRLRGDLGRQLTFLSTDRIGLPVEFLGIPAGAQLAGIVIGVAHPLPGDRHGRRHPFAQRGQRIPGLLCRGQPGHALAYRLLGLDLGLASLSQRRLQGQSPVAHRLLVGDVGLQSERRLDQVVGQQPGPGVADLGLDHRSLPGHLGLPAERLELATDLGDQIREPIEVALARLELAEGLLLALAVLEHPGGFLDEAAAALRRGLQDRIELALADDDVHLPADAGVAQQFLHIQQPHVLGVDGIFRAAVAEHGPGDRHLGVVDRQRAVGVVDRQHDLGAAERRPS